ncbi:hypothetical protein Trydic_g20964 [Trypoxylus dichotomus]
MVDVFLLHNNARPHSSYHSTEEIVKIGSKVLPDPPYNPDRAPSEFHLFGPLIEVCHEIHFEDEHAPETFVRQCLKKQDYVFYYIGIHALVKRWTEGMN